MLTKPRGQDIHIMHKVENVKGVLRNNTRTHTYSIMYNILYLEWKISIQMLLTTQYILKLSGLLVCSDRVMDSGGVNNAKCK